MAVACHMFAQFGELCCKRRLFGHEDVCSIGPLFGAANERKLECVFTDFVLNAFGHAVEPHPLAIAQA